MTRRSVGEALASRLYAAEAAIDAALFETASLAALLPGARSEAFLSAVTGQQVFQGAAASISALTEARGHLVDTHNALAALARRLGLEALALGPVDKPEDQPLGGSMGGGSREEVNNSLPISPERC